MKPEEIWRELAIYFLRGCNPRLDKEVVILECILTYNPVILDDMVIRHHAHAFVEYAKRVIEYRNASEPITRDEKWIHEWNEKKGVKR